MPLTKGSKLSVSFVLMHDPNTPILGSGQEARITIAPTVIPKSEEDAKALFIGTIIGGAERLWDEVVKKTWMT